MDSELQQALIFAAIGGVFIGAASGAFYLFQGKIAGISGILFDTATQPKTWRFAFLLGLVLAGVIFAAAFPNQIAELKISNFEILVSGLLIGVGTRLANGCTSGHGISGLARFAPRSIAAVGVFMLAAIITVFIKLHGFAA
ncbi:MAG: hypothetical protein FD163_910 [Hyphomonadaceae bacterium]|nr:MAG: hypothetical protein FD128_1071 [Hyphomonadaceae bacterium]KAF0186242.1 MAG: hypothetical protein FD163_910 [Hyphomonadaceae bacterium]